MHSAGEGSSRRRRSAGSGSGRASAPPPPPGLSSSVMAPVFERFHTFKEFMALQKDTLEPDRAVDLYDQYKYDFKIHSARMVFHQNQDLGFVRERFSPEHLSALASKKVIEARKEAEAMISVRLGSNGIKALCLYWFGLFCDVWFRLLGGCTVVAEFTRW